MQKNTKVSKRKGIGMRHLFTVLSCTTILSLLGGCAQFQTSKKMDAGPFGQNVEILMGDVYGDLSDINVFYIKPYMYGPTVEEYQKEWVDLKKVMRGIVLYSSQVVNVAQSNIYEEKKPNEIARYVNELLAPVVALKSPDLQLTQQELDTIVRNIAKQRNMFDALTEAQPLVDRVAEYVDDAFDRTSDLLNKLDQEINERMDTRWALNRSNVETLLALQGRTFKSYALLYQFKEGDPKGLDALRENDPALQPYLGNDRPPSEKELDTAEAQLMARLKNLYAIREQLMPQVELYLAQVRELDGLLTQHRMTGTKVRTTVMLWARSHANLAKGISVPPEIDLYNIMIGSAKRALPLP